MFNRQCWLTVEDSHGYPVSEKLHHPFPNKDGANELLSQRASKDFFSRILENAGIIFHPCPAFMLFDEK